MINFDAISEIYSQAKQQLISAQLELQESEAKATEFRERRAAACEERDRLLDLEQTDHVTRVLDGESSAPKKPKRLTRISNLHEEIAGIDLALPIHEQRLEAARQRVAAARDQIAEAVLPCVFEQKVEALARCGAPLNQLIEALVDAAALDALQEQFAAPDGSLRLSRQMDCDKLFSARIILDRFKKSLPPRFADLAADNLAAADIRITQKAKLFADQLGV